MSDRAQSQITLHLGDVLSAEADAIVAAIDGTITPRVEQLDRVLGNVGRAFVKRFPAADFLTELEAQLDLPLPLGRATVIEVSACPFRAVVLVSSLHHVEHLDGAAKRALVRTCMTSASTVAAAAGFGTVSTAVLQGGWRLPPDAAFAAMIDAITAHPKAPSVGIHCIDAGVFRALAPLARSLGVVVQSG